MYRKYGKNANYFLKRSKFPNRPADLLLRAETSAEGVSMYLHSKVLCTIVVGVMYELMVISRRSILCAT